MSNVADFLNMTPNDLPSPQILPEGTYEFSVTSYRTDEVGVNNTPLLKLNCKAVSIIDSELDEKDLRLALPPKLEFWLTEAAMPIANPATGIKSFLTNGLDLGHVSDVPFSELLEMAIGKTFKGLVKHEMVGKNKDITQASIKRILK
jgi:hypothetical protein